MHAMAAAPDRSPADARRLGAALEPVIGQVYFAPECHRAYVELGFGPSPGDSRGVALPDGTAYFTSRGALLGQVPGEVVAAAFGVFNPAVVVPAVTAGWTITDAETIQAARDRGAMAHLERLLGARPDGLERVEAVLTRAAATTTLAGRPLAAGARSLEPPDHPLGAVFRAGDVLREFRGDAHTAAWTSTGLGAVEIGLLTELYWGLPLRSYSRSRGWTAEDFDSGEERLRADGLIVGGAFTPAGRARREEIEVATDRQLAGVMAAIGDDLDELVTVLERWGRAIRDGQGYPRSGPHDLAASASV